MIKHVPIGTMALLFDYYVNDLENEKPFFEDWIPNLKKFSIIFWLKSSNDKTTPLPLVKNLVKILPHSSLVVFKGHGHINPALSKKKAYSIMNVYTNILNKLV